MKKSSTSHHPIALVTGGAGFIGSHVVDRLVADGYRVTVLDDLSSGQRKNIHPAANFLHADIGDPSATAWIRKNKPDLICHLAAQINVRVSIKEPVVDAETNVRASLGLLDAAAKASVKRFIFAGSGGALCGDDSPVPTPEDQISEPQSPYAIAKRTIELYGMFYQREYGLPFIALRFANVYGPRQNAKGEAGVVSMFATGMLTNGDVAVNGTGKQTRDFVFVEDVADAVLRASKKKTLCGAFNVGTGKETTITELFHHLAKIVGYKKKPKKGPPDKNAPLRSALDASLYHKATGWKAATPLREGLKKTVLHFETEIGASKRICLYPFKKRS
ncbi:MAG: NAD-dependent epimerase/dehydratase family protein [Patescibacteria group bacterium]